MAVTCLDIIHDALRQGVLASGQDATAEELSDALFTLSSMYEEWASGGQFGHLTDVFVDESREAKVGERVILRDEALVTFPTDREVDGKRVPLADLSLIALRGPDGFSWHLYESARGWSDLSRLEPTTIAPLSDRGRRGLACALAVRLLEGYGVPIPAATLANAQRFEASLSYKLTARDAEGPEYF